MGTTPAMRRPKELYSSNCMGTGGGSSRTLGSNVAVARVLCVFVDVPEFIRKRVFKNVAVARVPCDLFLKCCCGSNAVRFSIPPPCCPIGANDQHGLPECCCDSNAVRYFVKMLLWPECRAIFHTRVAHPPDSGGGLF